MNTRLTMGEFRAAIAVGIERQIEARLRGLPDRHGYEGDGWGNHIEGACGEIAVAKILGVHWDGSINTFKRGGDVGAVQVRTRTKHHYELIIRKDDDPRAVYFLVTGLAPTLCVAGWIWGHEGMQNIFLKEHGGRERAYFVPHSALNEPWMFNV